MTYQSARSAYNLKILVVVRKVCCEELGTSTPSYNKFTAHRYPEHFRIYEGKDFELTKNPRHRRAKI